KVAPTGDQVIVIDSQLNGVLSYSETTKSVKQNIFKEAVIRAAGSNPDYILLPEDYVSLGLESEGNYQSLKSSIPDFTGVIISMVATKTTDGQVLRGLFNDFGTGNTYYKDKDFLAPQGDYLTYVYQSILELFRLNQKLDEIETVASFRVGEYDG